VNSVSDFLATSHAAFLSDLAALVNIDCGTHNKAGVDRVGEWIGARCAAWDWQVERFPLGTRRLLAGATGMETDASS
jgi:glutamate carboxypeptidase